MFSKKKSTVWEIPLPFLKVAYDDGGIWHYYTLCHCAEPSTQQETRKGVVKYTKKNFHIIEPCLSWKCKRVHQFPSVPGVT